MTEPKKTQKTVSAEEKDLGISTQTNGTLDESLNNDDELELMASKEAELAARKAALEADEADIATREQLLAKREANLASGVVSVDVSVSGESGVDIDSVASVIDMLAHTEIPESLDPKKCPHTMTAMKCADNRRIPTLAGHVFRFYKDVVIYVPNDLVNHCKKYGATIVG